MRMIIFKIIAFMTLFIFMQSVVFPLAIMNNTIPLWVDIVVISFVLMLWLAVIDRVVFYLLKILKKNDESIEQN